MKQVNNFMILLLLSFAIFSCKADEEEMLSITISDTSGGALTQGLPGTQIVINGKGFSTTPTNNIVTFGTSPAVVNIATETALTVTIPNLPTGPTTITVTVNGVSTSVAFTIVSKSVQNIQADISTNTTWTADKVYVLDRFIYVNSGATLTIEPGTLIKGIKNSAVANGVGAIIVRPGGKISANGTRELPIVMTSGQPKGQRARGDWAGVVLIGKAPHNRPAGIALEGTIGGTYTTDAIADDNSGVLRYVRIEYAGANLSGASGNEINGLTMYAVGSGTTIEYVQVSEGFDDAFEWFGGTVNCKYLVAHRNFDDDFDTDYGYTGSVQYAVALRDPNVADVSRSNGFESDNFNPGEPATDINNGLPLTAPRFANISVFGTGGTPSTATTSGGSGAYQSAMHLRRNTAIQIWNSVFVGYPEGLRLDGTFTFSNAAPAGTLDLRGIVIANTLSPTIVGAGNVSNTQAEDFFNGAGKNNAVLTLSSLLLNANNFNLTAPAFLPGVSSPLLTGGQTLPSGFELTTYRGAFNTEDWTAGWTNFNPQDTDY
jgi:hypothetical protein